MNWRRSSMKEFDLLLNEINKKCTNWERNFIISMIGWNPKKIEKEHKKILLNLGITKLGKDEYTQLKSLLAQ